jgi:outer membrane protein OmpA-like peptidoglycan-associated protein
LNQKLSEKRAKAVMQYLVRHGVNQDRLKWIGFGPKHPIASNLTADGRKKNRRVELKPVD